MLPPPRAHAARFRRAMKETWTHRPAQADARQRLCATAGWREPTALTVQLLGEFFWVAARRLDPPLRAPRKPSEV